MSLLSDVSIALSLFFTGKLTPARVKLAYKDERAENDSNRIYPEATITLYDCRIAPERRYSGVPYVMQPSVSDPDTKVEVRKLPIPIDLFFQLDIHCEKQEESWNFNDKMLGILGAGETSVTTGDDRKFYLIPEQIAPLDSIADGIWLRAYRFKIEVWMDSAADVREVYVVLQRVFDINTEIFTPTEAES